MDVSVIGAQPTISRYPDSQTEYRYIDYSRVCSIQAKPVEAELLGVPTSTSAAAILVDLPYTFLAAIATSRGLRMRLKSDTIVQNLTHSDCIFPERNQRS